METTSCHGTDENTIEQADYERYGFGPDGAPIHGRSAVTQLAELHLPHGTAIQFVGSPEVGTGVVETGGAGQGAPIFVQDGKLSHLEMYARLAPKGAPIPDLLVRNSVSTGEKFEQLTSRRSTQESIDEPLMVDEDLFEIVGGVPVFRVGPSANSGPWNCNLGAAEFASFVGQGSYPSSTIMWVDATRQYPFRDRWTDARRRYSLSITAVCNTQIGYVRHYHRMPGWWALLYDASLPQNRWSRVSWEGIAGPAGRRARWVRHGVLPTPAGAYLRAFTAMYN